ncbi:Variant surface glycoprotein ILTAT 1.24 [Frankliniella fusca]|uniref:Variant surface glycoprotein ILTAT 1.24 n=1 Tax=Frankliniella fusca TaxID=407009 RepID=A0AAE1LNK9_9NEOP|nr:Variant surface glycoprotein ILTAT 1.24 [Frankliniella fusca]
MEPLMHLARCEANYKICVLCQNTTDETLTTSSETSLKSLICAAEKRKELHDEKNAHKIERILAAPVTPQEEVRLLYHRTCYQDFTNKSKVDRLVKQNKATNSREDAPTPVRILRSDPSARTDKNLCIFCQTPGDAKNIRKAATFALCEKIKKVSEYNYDIRRRVACGLDAVASDVMYHTYCLRREERKCEAGAGGTPKPLVNLAFDKICYELRVAADKSQVLRISAVFQRYTTLCAGIGEQVPAQYLSRMSTFKCDLEKRLKDVFEFYHPMDRENSERKTLLIPPKFSHTLTVKSAYGDHECTMPPYTPPENSDFNAIVHTALRLRSTLENVKGHIGANVEKSDALSLIPQDLHLFLSIMLGGVVIPANLKQEPGRTSLALLHLTADNVDIQLDTLDGKKSFHGTQLVAFQRGARPLEEVLSSITLSRLKSVKIPEAIQTVAKTNVKLNTIEPKIQEVKEEWYETSEISESRQGAKVQDLTYLFHRQYSNDRQGWTAYYKATSFNNTDITSSGYLPMILDPAHEFHTLHTVLQRAISLADHLDQKFVIVTSDQQVYCRLLELKWSSEHYRERIILRMGGLHLSLNFLKAIGKHMSGSGLEELWVESGVAAETMASKVMEGKVYSKGMRLMKLTLQALWRIILPLFQQHLLEVDPDLADKLTRSVCDIICLEEVLQENNIYLKINEWVKSTENVELQFWMTYVEMAHILLEFTRSMRDGKWDLYLSSLSQMLPYLARYDHHNYLKSLSVYIAEMHALPSEVEAAFRQGDFFSTPVA